MSPRRRRRPALLVAATFTTLLTTLALAPAAGADTGAQATAAAPTFGYQGTAYGSNVTVAGVVTSNPTAPVSFGCGTPAGFNRTATTAGVSVPPGLLTTGTLTSTGAATASPTQARTTASAQNVNVLGGLVTATAVTSASASSNDAGGYDTSSAGTSFASLRVLGLPVLLGPDPNTRITLPGVGYVVVNEQKSTVTATSASLRVVALRVVVNKANLLGFEVGTNIVVAQASSALTAPTGGFLGGFAYGTAAQVGPLLSSAPSFRISLPCEGTNGQLRQRGGVGVNVPGVLSSGTIRNTVIGTVSATTAFGESTATIESANLLDGLITATGVTSVATASRSGGTTTFSQDGTTFATITVDGESLVVADIAPNTRINLLGIGTLHLRRTITTPTSIEVRAIELVVAAGNLLGLPTGTTVQVAVAKAVITG